MPRSPAWEWIAWRVRGEGEGGGRDDEDEDEDDDEYNDEEDDDDNDGEEEEGREAIREAVDASFWRSALRWCFTLSSWLVVAITSFMSM